MLAAAALLAVVINCHPVFFLGRSYVSPATMNIMVYSRPPSMPGLPETPEIPCHGSDAAATMIQNVPFGYFESAACWQGEVPLWDRYGHAGQPFLGQAVTMLGDPLNLMVLLGHGSAWAWDVKFIAAKWLFCLGFGLLVRRIVGGGEGLALIYTVLAAWCGAFFTSIIIRCSSCLPTARGFC